MSKDRGKECQLLCQTYNEMCYVFDNDRLQNLLKQIFAKFGSGRIEQGLHVNYGTNTYIGKRFYANYNVSILDHADIHIGDNVLIGPNTVIASVTHPVNAEDRYNDVYIRKPICIGNHVWIGANCTILPGVTIGDNVVIGANSVVSKDIPANCVAVGAPCKVIKELEANQWLNLLPNG